MLPSEMACNNAAGNCTANALLVIERGTLFTLHYASNLRLKWRINYLRIKSYITINNKVTNCRFTAEICSLRLIFLILYFD